MIQTSRRDFLAASGLMAAAGALQPLQTSGRRLLLKGGCVVSLDSQIGEFESADVLIDGNRIAEVRPNISASAKTRRWRWRS